MSNTWRVASFLTLLCADASLHKTSRQANKLVYLHMFLSPERLGVELRKIPPEKATSHCVQSIRQSSAPVWSPMCCAPRGGSCSLCPPVSVLKDASACAPRLRRALSAHHLSSAVLCGWEGFTHTHASSLYRTDKKNNNNKESNISFLNGIIFKYVTTSVHIMPHIE